MKTYKHKNITIINGDCMEIMEEIEDKYYDLSCVDPPYGIGEDGLKNHSRGKLAETTKFTPKTWDGEKITSKYITELLRVSKKQIIWGANHFISRIALDSSCWIVWDKDNGKTDFADCELAWTSFTTAVRQFKFKWQGMLQGDMKNKEQHIHPTQKPIALYKWLLKNYAKEGDKILDTHLGSGSSAIACYDMGFEFTGIELDEEYFDACVKRFEKHIEQQALFTPKEIYG